MKKKNLFWIISVLTIAICLTGCKLNKKVEENQDDIVLKVSGEVSGDLAEIQNSGDGESGDEPINTFMEFESQFKEEVKPYVAYFSNVKSFLESGEKEKYQEYGVSVFFSDLFNKEDPFASISYLLKDLNNDGIEEILLFNDNANEENKNVILTICGFRNNDSYIVLNSQENMLFKLCDDNVIKMELPDIEFTEFSKLDENLELVRLDTIEVGTSLNDKQTKLNKYKEVNLELKKVK